MSGRLVKDLARLDSFEEHGSIHADDEMDKEHREDCEVIVRKGLNPECPECGNALDYIAFESERRVECDLAKSMEGFGGKHLVRGFGSSDCGCESHLLYLGGLKVTSSRSTRRCGT